MKYTKEQISKLVLEIISAADYDIGKSFDPDLAEEPEEAAEHLESIVAMATRWLEENDR